MIGKRFLTSICMASALAISMPSTPAVARHVVSDPAQNAQMIMDLVQMIMALKEEIEMVTQLTDMNATIGDLKKAGGQLFSGMESAVTDEVAKFADSTVSEGMKEIGFETAKEDASSMASLVTEKMLPSEDDTDAEAENRMKLRAEIRDSAVADAYANAVTYLSESTKSNEEKIQPAKQTVSNKETTKDKQDGANEVAVARLKEQIEGNRLTAELLKLQAAEAMAKLPKYDS